MFLAVYVAEETGLSLALSETLKTGFVVWRPIWKPSETFIFGVSAYSQVPNIFTKHANNWPRVYKAFFILNSTELEISNGCKS